MSSGSFNKDDCKQLKIEIHARSSEADVPGEEAFNGHDPTVTIGCHGPEKGVGSGLHVAVQHDCTLVTQDTDIPASGMQVDAAVKWVLVGVESHEVSSLLVYLNFPKSAYH
jgi:hypothetical protein